jgi:hypothetical protein
MSHPVPDSHDRAGDDAWLDRMLAEDAAAARHAYIDDAGFTASVMAALPAPATLPRWRKPAVAAMWAAAGLATAVALPDTLLDAFRETIRLVAGQPVSLSGMAAALGALAAATWAGTAYALRRD